MQRYLMEFHTSVIRWTRGHCFASADLRFENFFEHTVCGVRPFLIFGGRAFKTGWLSGFQVGPVGFDFAASHLWKQQLRSPVFSRPGGAEGHSTMLWLALPAMLYMFRGRLASTLAPMVGSLDPQRTAMLGHLLTVVLGLIYIVPLELVGLRGVKRPVFLLSLWTNIATLLWSLTCNYGLPPMPQVGNLISNFRQYGQAAIQMMIQPLAPWLTKAMSGADFHWLFFVLIWMAAHPSVFAILIIGRRSL
eukprot:s934_g6.t1